MNNASPRGGVSSVKKHEEELWITEGNRIGPKKLHELDYMRTNHECSQVIGE